MSSLYKSISCLHRSCDNLYGDSSVSNIHMVSWQQTFNHLWCFYIWSISIPKLFGDSLTHSVMLVFVSNKLMLPVYKSNVVFYKSNVVFLQVKCCLCTNQMLSLYKSNVFFVQSKCCLFTGPITTFTVTVVTGFQHSYGELTTTLIDI